MFLKKDTPKWKIHVFFASLLPLAFTLEFVIRLIAGNEVKVAAVESLRQVNLFLLLYHIAFWYSVATGRIGSEGKGKRNLITLNLNDKEI
jgi:hypothetical protein